MIHDSLHHPSNSFTYIGVGRGPPSCLIPVNRPLFSDPHPVGPSNRTTTSAPRSQPISRQMRRHTFLPCACPRFFLFFVVHWHVVPVVSSLLRRRTVWRCVSSKATTRRSTLTLTGEMRRRSIPLSISPRFFLRSIRKFFFFIVVVAAGRILSGTRVWRDVIRLIRRVRGLLLQRVVVTVLRSGLTGLTVPSANGAWVNQLTVV